MFDQQENNKNVVSQKSQSFNNYDTQKHVKLHITEKHG